MRANIFSTVRKKKCFNLHDRTSITNRVTMFKETSPHCTEG